MNVKIVRIISVTVAVALVIGLIFLSHEVQKLRDQVTQLSQRPLVLTSIAQPRPVHRSPSRVMTPDFFDDNWDPYTEIENMQRQMDALMRQRHFNEPPVRQNRSMQNTVQMSTHFKEDKDKYVLYMDIPGMKKEDIQVEIKEHTLFITGQRHQEEKKTGDQYVSQEGSFGYFSQALPLPKDANTKGISVNYRDGVLVVEIPRLVTQKSGTGSIRVKVR